MAKIKKILHVPLIFLFIIIFFSDTEAQRRRRTDYFLKPQVGLWFGPITPIYTTNEDVDTNLGGGLFFRYNTPLQTLKLGLDTSYQYFESNGVNTLTLWPVYGNLVYRIPLPTQFPLTIQLKAGAGTSYVKIRPDRIDQWDPLLMAGFEFSFPAGKVVNIGLRIDYLMIYEQHIDGANKNGHVIDTGITLFFNI
ncbi:MAG: hypothetical protein SVR08_18050 [Spirochaetota bacterium]|nr:hypothetical protein [Spirochaetota bacterium]